MKVLSRPWGGAAPGGPVPLQRHCLSLDLPLPFTAFPWTFHCLSLPFLDLLLPFLDLQLPLLGIHIHILSHALSTAVARPFRSGWPHRMWTWPWGFFTAAHRQAALAPAARCPTSGSASGVQVGRAAPTRPGVGHGVLSAPAGRRRRRRTSLPPPHPCCARRAAAARLGLLQLSNKDVTRQQGLTQDSRN